MRAEGTRTVIQLPMPDIPCRHVIRVITARLRDVPGVETVEMDAAAGAVVVTGRMSRAAASEAVDEARHQVRHLSGCPASP